MSRAIRPLTGARTGAWEFRINSKAAAVYIAILADNGRRSDPAPSIIRKPVAMTATLMSCTFQCPLMSIADWFRFFHIGA